MDQGRLGMDRLLSRTLIACFLCSAVVVGHDSVAQSRGIVFRYLPGQPTLSTNVGTVGVEEGPFIDGRELPARGPGGWGFAAPLSAEYEAPNSTAQGQAVDSLAQPLGPKITLEAWIRSPQDAQTATLLTNQVSDGDGMTLGLEQGRPYASLKIGTEYRVTGDSVVGGAEDHWIAATMDFSSGALKATMYLNGREIGSESFEPSISGPYVFRSPYFVGASASGSRDAPILTGEFSGHVFAAIVRSYVANEIYLNSLLPLDGGAYFGLPAYHDYPEGSAALPMDLRIRPEPVHVRDRIFLPYANDLYIPQGTAFNVENRDSATSSLVYVSYYHRLRSGAIGTQRSIVAEIDAETGRVRRTFRLMGQLEFSHAGGIALANDAFFISSAGMLERYAIPPFEGPDGPRYFDVEPDVSGTINTPSKASFVSTFRDTLWVGDYRLASEEQPFLYAHALDPDGRPERTASRAYAIPRRIQGVEFLDYAGATYVFMSRNRNSTEAEILRFNVSDLDSIVVPAPEASVTMPYGIEDLAFTPDSVLWTNSESGTDYYQRRAVNPWLPFYPFVYSVESDVLLADVTATWVETRPTRQSTVGFETFPNPSAGATTIEITLAATERVNVSIYDILGRHVADVIDDQLSAGVTRLTWTPVALPAGQLFAVVSVGGSTKVHPILRTN